MQRQLAQPVQLFLAQPPTLAPGERRPPVAAVVDAGAALADVTALVRAYGLVPAGTTTSMLPAAPAVGGVVAHRADGSCVSGIALNMTDSVESLLDALAANMVRCVCVSVRGGGVTAMRGRCAMPSAARMSTHVH